ncbi:MAG: metal-sensitive transcriptional regulator [SAR202 cluster bacterium]|uniref:Repressor CsoR of the copZA operon n=2 Tax=ecological metagenomes TaxID=410657 RepID=A0A160V7R7_9ZZZZ|nr:metal-sensitive transcriptional regulator [Dehalococcoidia bacterium]MED5588137.1 metal-sensitive transcriptional regulator [Chloroflexota bacterium]MQF92034.1 metal-sensitive transcriptional regulator [SAR202 cluster bacterium]MCH2500193.1 metal-sensitive transcriptional regulator [Dehalococcoidia bacterium]MCL0053421.1 metal-sensitive transcriptional regulator [Dehalococcoidia bacterium]|tara:strand:- start:1790 stop:2056 length:267 start_codon:yes stop_codon:yes gene_type:complete
MLSEVKQDALKRMSYIEGHLAGIRKMLDEDKYCVDVLKQTYAVRRAIEKMESLLLEGHLKSCVVEGIRSGRAEEIVEELKGLYILSTK